MLLWGISLGRPWGEGGIKSIQVLSENKNHKNNNEFVVLKNIFFCYQSNARFKSGGQIWEAWEELTHFLSSFLSWRESWQEMKSQNVNNEQFVWNSGKCEIQNLCFCSLSCQTHVGILVRKSKRGKKKWIKNSLIVRCESICWNVSKVYGALGNTGPLHSERTYTYLHGLCVFVCACLQVKDNLILFSTISFFPPSPPLYILLRWNVHAVKCTDPKCPMDITHPVKPHNNQGVPYFHHHRSLLLLLGK